MLKKNTIFDFLVSVMVIYGITVISICVFTYIFGDEAQEISSIYSLGQSGIALKTLVQFLLMSFLVGALRWMCFTDVLIKNFSIAGRTITMFTSVIALVGIFAGVFRWFPVDMALPWIMFFICFFIYATVGVVLSVWKEKKENKILQDALERLKEENE
ncbi:MAG: hypothetical protein Q4D54_00570 [Eubacteriales bacterium]|nr:hypothetical protein [Lachnospiraceae bacterium]MDO5126224.1 hypothetical protein [Eubacteriales bacterium]